MKKIIYTFLALLFPIASFACGADVHAFHLKITTTSGVVDGYLSYAYHFDKDSLDDPAYLKDIVFANEEDWEKIILHTERISYTYSDGEKVFQVPHFPIESELVLALSEISEIELLESPEALPVCEILAPIDNEDKDWANQPALASHSIETDYFLFDIFLHSLDPVSQEAFAAAKDTLEAAVEEMEWADTVSLEEECKRLLGEKVVVVTWLYF